MLRIAHAAVPTLGVWALAALASCSHQSVYSVVGKDRYSGLVDALPAIRTKWIEEAGTDAFEPWLRALGKALPAAFLTCAAVLPDSLRPPVPGLQEEKFERLVALHTTDPSRAEALVASAAGKSQVHFDRLNRLIAAHRRNTEVKAA